MALKEWEEKWGWVGWSIPESEKVFIRKYRMVPEMVIGNLVSYLRSLPFVLEHSGRYKPDGMLDSQKLECIHDFIQEIFDEAGRDDSRKGC